MSTETEISELRERMGRAEHQLDVGGDRFKEVSEALNGLASAVTEIKEHLGRQDSSSAEIKSSIEGIVGMWEGGARWGRGFCKAARTYEWAVTWLLSKKGLATLGIIALVHYLTFQTLPVWATWAMKGYALLEKFAG